MLSFGSQYHAPWLNVLITKFCVQAIANPQSAECQEKAWQAIVPIVLQLKRYYEFSVALGQFLLAIVSLFILTVS